MNAQSTTFPLADHDHRHCVAKALQAAETLCEQQALRLTPMRRRVLELIWSSHRPSGAYDLLELLAGEGHKPSPPTVYRALEFLLAHGLIHRVSSRNAFIGCAHAGQHHTAQIFICDRCNTVVEQADTSVDRRIHNSAEHLDFEIREQTVEIAGICPHCRAHDSDA